MLSQTETVALLQPLLQEKGRTYKKYKRAFVRRAVQDERVRTIVAGKVETENVARDGDMVVRADTTFQEEYILKPDDFERLYDVGSALKIEDHPDAEELMQKGFMSYAPTRRAVAIEVDEAIARHFPTGQFLASWGEPMRVEVGDYLASGRLSADGTVLEIIRIERSAFDQTYALA
mmetsp:Transcript_48425/g.90749  ORF Transcript_48425/g.90749 Transcript_48425/m.90749 type:complete len:176 (+) Transcript_48425:128-655(+)